MHYTITHTTTFQYAGRVSISQHAAHLRPRKAPRQSVKRFRLKVSPKASDERVLTDYFGNPQNFFVVEGQHNRLEVSAISEVEVEPAPKRDAASTPAWETLSYYFDNDGLAGGEDRAHCIFDSPMIRANRALADYAKPFFKDGRPILEGAVDLCSAIHKDFAFDPTATTVSTPLEEMFLKRRGVCQDFAHLQIGCLRSLGLPARYVSGYILTAPPPGQPKLLGSDASHAWVSVYCGEQMGWVDLDPTNDLLTSDQHITVAWGRDYEDVSPLRGQITGTGSHSLFVAVDVIPKPAEAA
jgi:transglutaminase-like putative cysteine protease